ncbi:MAG TPA: transglutaminase family protein, partial [Terrimicrobiaceae bacterium]
MLISFGYDIALRLPAETAVIFCLKVNPSRRHDIVSGENFQIEPHGHFDEYVDGFGNLCGRTLCQPGIVRFVNQGVIKDSGRLDPYVPDAVQHTIPNLPPETLVYLLPSRYCEVDSELAEFAWANFSATPLGWPRIQAVCDFVHGHLSFDYQQARATRTALDAFRERVGVCRDFTHLAVALCRCMNIPARYATGYLGDIGVPPAPDPMDFSAWMEAYVGGRWYTFDPRNNCRRIGRIVMARGRDASDVALTTVFGSHTLEKFHVVTAETTSTDALEPSLNVHQV